MQRENLINILLYVISLTLIFGVAYPIYSGGGINLLQKSNSILSELTEKKELDNLYMIAGELRNVGENQGNAFKNIDFETIDRIDKSIAKTLDIPRVINDFSVMAVNSNLKLANVIFTKNTNNKKYPSLNTYDISLTLEGEYLNFKSFVQVIEQSLELYNIKTLTFSKGESPNDPFKFNIILEAFELK